MTTTMTRAAEASWPASKQMRMTTLGSRQLLGRFALSLLVLTIGATVFAIPASQATDPTGFACPAGVVDPADPNTCVVTITTDAPARLPGLYVPSNPATCNGSPTTDPQSDCFWLVTEPGPLTLTYDSQPATSSCPSGGSDFPDPSTCVYAYGPFFRPGVFVEGFPATPPSCPSGTDPAIVGGGLCAVLGAAPLPPLHDDMCAANEIRVDPSNGGAGHTKIVCYAGLPQIPGSPGLASTCEGLVTSAATAADCVVEVLEVVGSYAAQPKAVTTCAGRAVTVNLALGELATNGPDVILGTSGPDVVAAGDGDDVICAMGGDDVIWGQNGNDIIFGGPGDDRLRGGALNDELFGGDGADDLAGGTGNDEVMGEAGDDKSLRGGTGEDTVDGGPGNDLRISGNGGEDLVFGGDGDDVLVLGGPRPDFIDGGVGNDILKGGGGADELFGSAGDDDLRGGAQPDMLNGGDGIDVCSGGTTGTPAIENDSAVNCETVTAVP